MIIIIMNALKSAWARQHARTPATISGYIHDNFAYREVLKALVMKSYAFFVA